MTDPLGLRIDPRADPHVHFREDEREITWNLDMVCPDTDIVVPIANHQAWIKTGEGAVVYRDKIKELADRKQYDLEIVPSIMLAQDTTPKMIVEACARGVVEVKCMFEGLSTNSRAQLAVEPDHLFDHIDTLRAISGEGMVLALHLEVKCRHGVVSRRFDRERDARPLLGELYERVPGLRIAVKHVSTAEMADFILGFKGAIGFGMVPQHYETSVHDMIDDKLNLANVFLPVPQELADVARLRAIAVARYPFVWLETDQALHPWNARKARPLAACGAVSAHVAGSTAISMFEQSGHPDWPNRLEQFWRHNFKRFYGISRPANRQLHWIKKPWTVPDWYEIPEMNDKVLPLLWGKTMEWQLVKG